jgi:hypothetical protein
VNLSQSETGWSVALRQLANFPLLTNGKHQPRPFAAVQIQIGFGAEHSAHQQILKSQIVISSF